MPQMTHRLQLLLDDDRYARVADLARRTGKSVAAVIRDAIDRNLAPDEDRRAAAGRAILAAPPMDVPDVDELRREFQAMHDQRSDRW